MSEKIVTYEDADAATQRARVAEDLAMQYADNAVFAADDYRKAVAELTDLVDQVKEKVKSQELKTGQKLTR
jgi:hypothetical protein